MSDRFDISVIVPLYNVENLIRASFESLLRQTIGFDRLQVIFVDDCSADNSFSIANEYAQKYANVQAFKTEKNSGAAGEPRNIGLKHVQAPYVMFLDADDFFADDACQILFDKIKETGAEIVGSSYWRVNYQGENPVLGDADLPDCETGYLLPDDIDQAVKKRGALWTKIFRAQLIRENNITFLYNSLGEDTTFVCECFVHAKKYVYIPDRLYYYRSNDSSVTKIVDERFFQKNLSSIVRCSEVLSPYENTRKWLLEHLYGYYWWTVILERNTDKEQVAKILTKYSALFGSIENAVPTIQILSILQQDNHQMLAAEYIAQLRLSYDMETAIDQKNKMIEQNWKQMNDMQLKMNDMQLKLNDMQLKLNALQLEVAAAVEEQQRIYQEYENRFVIRMANALKKKQFLGAIRLLLGACKRRLFSRLRHETK